MKLRSLLQAAADFLDNPDSYLKALPPEEIEKMKSAFDAEVDDEAVEYLALLYSLLIVYVATGR